jgi:hypothetical protein
MMVSLRVMQKCTNTTTKKMEKATVITRGGTEYASTVN